MNIVHKTQRRLYFTSTARTGDASAPSALRGQGAKKIFTLVDIFKHEVFQQIHPRPRRKFREPQEYPFRQRTAAACLQALYPYPQVFCASAASGGAPLNSIRRQKFFSAFSAVHTTHSPKKTESSAAQTSFPPEKRVRGRVNVGAVVHTHSQIADRKSRPFPLF